MAATTPLLARQALLRALPELGMYFSSIDALAAGSITITPLANSLLTTSEYANNIIHRPAAATAADITRFAGLLTVASGALAVSPNYTDTTATNETVEIWYDPTIRPDIHILRLFQDALRQIKFRATIPLYHGPASADMQGSNVDSDWTESGATDSVQTTASEIFSNAQSLVVTDSGSGNGYTASAAQKVGQGRTVYFFAIVKADTGTSMLRIMDGSSNEQASVSTTQEDWMLLKKQVAFDSTDETFTMRLQEVAASDSGDWQAAWYVKADRYNFELPSWFDDTMTPVGISVGNFNVAGTESDTWLADSSKVESLIEGTDYQWIRSLGDAHILGVRILNELLLSEPLFLTLDCPWSTPYGVAASFSSETDTTDCPISLLIPQAKILIGEAYKKFEYLIPRGSAEKLTELRQTQNNEKPPTRNRGWSRVFRGW